MNVYDRISCTRVRISYPFVTSSMPGKTSENFEFNENSTPTLLSHSSYLLKKKNTLKTVLRRIE